MYMYFAWCKESMAGRKRSFDIVVNLQVKEFVKKESNRAVDESFILCRLTKHLQPVDGSWNKPFKEVYDPTMMNGLIMAGNPTRKRGTSVPPSKLTVFSG